VERVSAEATLHLSDTTETLHRLMRSDSVSAKRSPLAVERVIERILSLRKDLSRERVEAMIKERVAELEGLIDEETAALLVAKELGVPLPPLESGFENKTAKLLVKDLIPGLKRIKLIARLVRLPPPLQLNSGKKLQRMVLADESGCVDAVAWDGAADAVRSLSLKPGDCIYVKNASVSEYRGRIELVLGEGAEVEKLGTCNLPELEELLTQCGVNAFTMVVHEVVGGSGGYCAYGVTREGVACVLVQAESGALSLKRGDLVLVQDPRRLPGGLQRYRLTRMSRVFVLGSQPVNDSPFRIASVDDVQGLSEYLIGVRGRFAAALPSKRGAGVITVLVGSLTSVNVLMFDDPLITEIRTLKPGMVIEVLGVYSSEKGLRLNPFYSVRKLGWENPAKVSETLAEGGYVSCCTTVLSLSFRLRLLANGEPLLGAVISVDDGTARARLLTSYGPHVQELTGSSWDEIREYASSGVLPHVLSFCEEYLRGAELEVEGWLSRDGVLAATKLKVL